MNELQQLFGVSPLALALLCGIGTFGFMVSATFGIGGAILLIPVLSLVMPPAHAVALSAPVTLASNLAKTWVYRRAVNVDALWRISVLAVPAAALSALLTGSVDDRIVLGSVAALVLTTLWFEHRRATTVQVSPRALIGWGVVTGVVSGMCGGAGPPMALGLRGYGLSQTSFVGTVALSATLLQAVKIPSYLHTGVLPRTLAPLGVLLGTLAVLSAIVAPRVLARVPSTTFRRIVDVMLLVTAVWLFVDAVRRSL